MTETFYDVLDVPADANQAAIRDAYRRKAKEHHPDVSDDPDAEERFKRIKRAEDVLGDPEERETYDRLGHDAYLRTGSTAEEGDSDTTDDVRTAAARAADRNHDAGGRSAGWRERERRARRRGRDYWASTVEDIGGDAGTDIGGFGDDGASRGRGRGSADPWSTVGTGSSRASTGTNTDPGNGRARRTTASDGGESSPGYTHAVHSWEPVEDDFRVGRPGWTQDHLLFLGATLFLYPILLFFTVVEFLPTVANVAIGLVTLAYVAFLLPRPGFALPVFGTWSILMPAVLIGLDVSVLSLVGLVALTGVWVPLLYAIAVAYVLVG